MSATIRQKSFNQKLQLYGYDILGPQEERVGMAQLRLIPSKNYDMPAGFESHIYYEISEGYRGEGYATDALRALISEAKKHGISSLTATVNVDNAASIRVIEKNRGNLVATGETLSGTEVFKYIFRI